MIRIITALLLVSTAILTGCATLTKSQVQAVNEYATLTDTGVSYPEKVLDEAIESQFKARLLDGSQNVSSTRPLAYSTIVQYSADRVKGLEASKRFRDQLSVLDAYAQALKRLSSPDFVTTAATSADALGKSVDKVTATFAGTAVSGIGTALSTTLKAVSGPYIRSKQTKAIQQYVQAGDTLVSLLCLSNEKYFTTNVSGYIDGIENSTQATADNVLKSFSGSLNAPLERYQAAGLIADFVVRYESLRQLNAHTVQALRQIRLAHNELRKAIMTKQELKDVGPQIMELYQTINDLRTAYHQVKF